MLTERARALIPLWNSKDSSQTYALPNTCRRRAADGAASIFRRPSSLVVPAKAGTHTPRPLDLGTVANGFCSNKRRWLWFRRDDARGFNLQTAWYESAFSPLVSREVWPVRSALGNRGRRESRVRAAPAVSRARMCKETHTSIQVQRRQSGLPCAMVLRLITRSPR
jgi:hypothetical protein